MTFGGTTYGGAPLGSTATTDTTVSASATLAGSATLDATGTQNIHVAATLAGSATVDATGTQIVTGASTLAGSASLFPDTGFVPGVSSSGWHVVVIHPESHRRIQPDVLDEPTILPSLNSLPEIRIPVRKSDAWLDPAFEDDPWMQVWLDGVRQPIDILQTIEDREDRTILVGVGATELRDRVSAEYRSERRHIAAQNLITGETTYAEDVDTPSVESVTGETLQSPTTTSEIEADLDLPADNVINTSGGEVTIYQTSWTMEAESFNRSTDTSTTTDTDYSDGSGIVIGSTSSQAYEWDFTTGYAIPSDNFEVGLRLQGTGTQNADVTWYLDGTKISEYAPSTTGIIWNENIISDSTGSNLSGDIAAGSHTLKVEADSTTGDLVEFDVVQPYDTGDRFGGFTYTYDNTVNTTDGWLDGPGLHPENGVEVMGEDETSAFSIVAADATISIDTLNQTGPGSDQYLQVSNDRGSNWEPTDGTEDNTNSVDVNFGTSGSALRLRFNLDAYSPSGTRNQTPRENYDAQTVTDWTLNADIDLELLLINQTYDNSLASILNDIAGNEFVWSANLDASGNYQVSWTQPGQRVASDDPDIGSVNISKNIDTFDRISIKGSPKQVTDHEFSASTTFVDLPDDNLIPGSESVYDSATGTNFDLDADYEMDYSAGKIRATAGGDLDTTQTYSVDYRAEIVGSYPSDVTSPDREFVDTVPGVVTDRGAEQIAFALFDGDAENPRYEGDLSLPRSDISFDPLEALSLTNLDLPAEATPLDIRGEPSITPSGLTLRLGSRPPIEQSLSSIAENVAAISKRT